MSTKIHHGYRVSLNSLADLGQFNVTLKSALLSKADFLCSGITAKLAADALDRHLLGLSCGPDDGRDAPLYRVAWAEYSRRQIDSRKTRKRDPDVDLDFWWRFHILPSGKIYALIGFEAEEFAEVWKGMSQVEHYPYWNNTDGPDDLSQEAWEARGDEWNHAVKAPALAHELFESFNAPACPPVDAVVAAQPAHARRVRWFARNAALDEVSAMFSDEESRTGFEVFFKAERHLRDTDEGKAVLQRHVERVGGILPERYAAVDFLREDIALPKRYA